MADKKISELTSASLPLSGTEEIPIVQSGVTKKVAVSEIGGGATPSLQAVTDIGNTTTNEITAGNFVSAGSGNFGGIILNDGDLNQVGSITSLATSLNPRDYNLPDESGIIATREWVNSKSYLQWLVKDTTPTTEVTGTTSLTQIGSTILIPANTFSAEDVMILDGYVIEKIGNLGVFSIRFYHNTSDTLTGATSIAFSSIIETNKSTKMVRTFEITGGLLKYRIGNISSVSDIISSTTTPLSISFDTTIDNYFFTTVQLGNASDSVTRTQLLISK